MKKVFFLSLVAFISTFISVTTVFAQDLPKANVNKELYVMLHPGCLPDARIFEADLRYDFADLETANRFFSFFNDPSVTFEPNLVTRKVIITITSTPERQEWTIEQWATYFKDKVVEQRQQIGVVDFTTR